MALLEVAKPMLALRLFALALAYVGLCSLYAGKMPRIGPWQQAVMRLTQDALK